MILQALTHLYAELEKQGKVSLDGWGKAKVTHRLILDENGTLIGIISTTSKKNEPISMDVPYQEGRSGTGAKAYFLCDTAKYMLGIDNSPIEKKEKGKGEKEKAEKGQVSERSKKCFEDAKTLHHRILDGCNSVVAQAILSFFDHWNVEKSIDNPVIQRWMPAIKKTKNFIFQINETDAIEDESIRKAWKAYRERVGGKPIWGTCLVTGKVKQKICENHPAISGFPGASKPAKLISYKNNAFCSFGKDGKKGQNAPISKEVAFAYGTALNYLFADKKHQKLIGDTMVVYWSEHALFLCQDFMADLLGDENGIDDETLDAVLNYIKKGETISLDGIDIDAEEPFYILGLALNAARVSVRFFMKNTFGKVIMNLSAHQERMDLIHPSWEKRRIPVWKTLQEIINPHTTNKVSSPLLSGSLMRSVLNNTRYPEALYQNIMMRIFADKDQKGENRSIQKINYVRAAFIKAYLLKNGSKRWKEQLKMDVNENCNEISYVLGRMFSVLEEIQQDSNEKELNSTIKDRYFNSACATPSVVFPILWKLANAHLNKLRKGKPGRAVNLQKKLGALMGKIVMPDSGVPLPAHLTLEEQGAFVVGYYQETQARYNKKSESNEVNKEEK